MKRDSVGRFGRWLAILCAIGALSFAAAAEVDRSVEALLIRVEITDRDREVPKLQRLDVDVSGVDGKSGTIDVVGDRSTYDALVAFGFRATIERPLPTEPDANNLTYYMDPSEVDAALNTMVASFPTLAKKILYATTEEGRSAYALKISDNVGAEEDEPSLFFFAQHHAREVMTTEIAVDIASQLLNGYGVDPQVTAWVNSREIYVLPVHNPDGASYVFRNGPSWRKNRRNNGDGTFGVDLNRNYSFLWNACNGSSGTPLDPTYRGPFAASEPETSGIELFARDRRPVVSLSYHSYGEQVMFPYGCTGLYAAERSVFRRLSSDIAARLVSDDGTHWYQVGAPWEILYSEDGETNGWMYGVNGTYSFEIEANAAAQGFQPSYAQWRDSTVTRSRPAWKYLLDRIDGPGISGHVTDACSGSALAATISLDEITFQNGETPRTSEQRFGRYQWLTNAGAFHVRAALGGYVEQAWPVSVGSARVDRPIRLVPSGGRAVAPSGATILDAAGDGDGEADPGESLTLRIGEVNIGGTALSGVAASLTSADPYLTITDASSSYGSIGVGASAQGDGFGLSISPDAPDEHTAMLHVHAFANDTLCAADLDLPLRITGGHPACAVVQNLDGNPGWAIDNSAPGGWAFGAPVGDGGTNGPATAATGTNVYGTNLQGAYGTGADYKLTAGPYDLTGYRHAALSYRRWLDNEPGRDLASAEISTNGGASWLPLTSGFGYGEGWELESLDMGPAVDAHPDVRVRFRLQSDASTVRSGFYVDDLSICGEKLARAPNGIGVTLRVAKSANDLTLEWSPPPTDPMHDAPVAYRVYRSIVAASGYSLVRPAATQPAVLADEAATPESRFYLVAAFNSGGTSPDLPLP